MTYAELICATRGYHTMQRWGVGNGTAPSSVLWANHETCYTCGYQERAKGSTWVPPSGTA